ncbi:ATP-binding protein [Crassaminicella thermophila]|uniref:ATP-binding protein n=1 Tax=Crassaminicella thermophila TaxID=2599308 RepID=A0A5C0SDQ4_CRATE|nr:ATP-binding protein [Crassaminicella thermophila]QEK12695.1 ATP-binding protein [Crassaminicella thermophila]
MDFFTTLFGVDIGITQCRYDCSNRLMELKKKLKGQNPNEDSQIAEHFKHIFQSQIKGDSNILEAVSYSIGEIVDNTIRHSLSPINGFICAQTYRNKRKLEICIADCGIGIPKSLKSSNNIDPSERDCLVYDHEYILYALRKGISSKYGKGHTGEGLFFSSEFIKENYGRMKIISGKGLCLIKNGNDVLQMDIDCWTGTIVALEFQLDNEVNVKNIFDREFPMDSTEDFDWI